MANKVRWTVTNLTDRTIVIGDLPRVPRIRPGYPVDLMQYYGRHEILQSIELERFCRNGSLRLTKSQTGLNSRQITSGNSRRSLSSVERDQIQPFYSAGSLIQANGIYNQGVNAQACTLVTANYTIQPTDNVVIADTRLDDIVITVPLASVMTTYINNQGLPGGVYNWEIRKPYFNKEVTVRLADATEACHETTETLLVTGGDGIIMKLGVGDPTVFDLANKWAFQPSPASIPFRTPWAPGLINDPGIDISDPEYGESMTVGEGELQLYATDDYTGDIHHFHIEETTFDYYPTENVTLYIVAHYNNGDPEYATTEDIEDINGSDVIPIYTVINDGEDIHYRSFANLADGYPSKIFENLVKTRGFVRESGLSIAAPSDRTFTISTGRVWYGTIRYYPEAYDSSEGGLYIWYHTALGAWTQDHEGLTEFDNTRYDDAAAGVQTLTNGKYNVQWVYRLINDDDEQETHIILHPDEFDNTTDAEAAEIPTIPLSIYTHCILVGRIICLKNAASAAAVASAFTTTFTAAAVTDHANLTSLQGGQAGEYYHLTSAEHTGLTTGASADALHTHTGSYETHTFNAHDMLDRQTGWNASSNALVTIADGLSYRRFLNANRSCGIQVYVPATASNIIVTLVSRSEGEAATAVVTLYGLSVRDNQSLPGWESFAMAAINLTADSYYQYDSETITIGNGLGEWDIGPGEVTLIEIRRTGGTIGVWDLLEVLVTFS